MKTGWTGGSGWPQGVWARQERLSSAWFRHGQVWKPEFLGLVWGLVLHPGSPTPREPPTCGHLAGLHCS